MLTRRGNLVAAGIALAVAEVAVVVIVALGSRGAQPSGRTPVALGEWIYRTGTDPNGTPIPASGGMMMRAGCVTCHGSDGRGRTTPMFASPNITYASLTDPKGMLQPDGSRGPTYTDGTLKRAVIQGIDPEGYHLARPMPQWQLTDQEWVDLLSYLKTLR